MNTKNIMLAIWNQLTRKGAWRNIFVTHNAFGIFSQYSQKIKAFRASLRGIVDEKFFLYRLAKIYAYPH